jgi:hypothetical protein
VGVDELRLIKTVLDQFFRVEHMLLYSNEPMSQEALDATTEHYHSLRARLMQLAGIPEPE